MCLTESEAHGILTFYQIEFKMSKATRKTYVYQIARQKDVGDTTKGYIGVSYRPMYRFAQHKGHSPCNLILTRNFNKYEDLVMKILFEGTEQEAYKKEEELRPDPAMGWNIVQGGNIPPTRMGGKVSDETKLKQSKAKLGNTNVGEGENHHFYGKVGKDSVRFGTKGEKSPNHKGFWLTPEGKFGSMSLAADHFGLAKSTIHYRCKTSTAWQKKGWCFLDKEE